MRRRPPDLVEAVASANVAVLVREDQAVRDSACGCGVAVQPRLPLRSSSRRSLPRSLRASGTRVRCRQRRVGEPPVRMGLNVPVAGEPSEAMVSRLVGGVLSQDQGPVGDHPSVRPTWPIGRAARGTLGLAPSGGCRAAGVATDAGALLPHRFTLTCAATSGEAEPSAVCSLLPCTDRSPRPGSRQRSALWSPDLPRPSAN